MQSDGERISTLERGLDKLLILQEGNQKLQTIATRNIDSLREDIKKMIGSNGEWKVVDTKATSAHKRIDKLENNQSWAIRIVLGAVFLAILGTILIK